MCVGGGLRSLSMEGLPPQLHRVCINVLPLSRTAEMAVLVVSASPVCSSLLGERPYISTVSSAGWVGPVPVCREVNGGRVAMWAETVRTGKGLGLLTSENGGLQVGNTLCPGGPDGD